MTVPRTETAYYDLDGNLIFTLQKTGMYPFRREECND